MASMEVLRSSSSPFRRQSTPDAMSLPPLIPEVRETSVIMSGILEVHGLTTTSTDITPTSSGLTKRANRVGGQKVIVCVYQTSREHFAVVYPLRMMISARKPIASINLRTSTVSRLTDDSFRVDPNKDRKGATSDKMIFKILASHRLSPDSTMELDRWLDALTKSNCGRKSPTEALLSRSPTTSYIPVMATVTETDADEDLDVKG